MTSWFRAGRARQQNSTQITLEVAMKMPLSLSILGLVSLFAIMTGAQQPARAEAYPTRPVKVIVPYQPGAAADVIGRF